MTKIILKEFQKKAINELKEEFLHRLVKSGKQEIKFEAPTGSGKTIMMADFVRSLILQEPRLEDTDLCFL
ncbi:MAG: DEAD/DEAH box helicase family protein [Cyanobium sp. MAG06]|nr:DEAD/DEAH box helicase family protein [Cyanobium sp. MAG06]